MDTKTKNRMKRSNLCSFLVLGTLEAAWAPMVPYIKDRFALSEGDLGLLLLCSGLGSFAFLPVIGMLCSRLGCRRTVYICGTLLSLTLLGIATSADVYLCALMLFVFGAMGIGVDVSSNVNAVMVEAQFKKPLMSGFHGGYSLGTLIGSALASALLTLGLNLASDAFVIMLLALVAVFLGGRYLLSDIRTKEQGSGNVQNAAAANKRDKPRFFVPPLVIVVGVMCFFMYSIEGAVMSWSAVFVTQERNISLEAAGFIYTSFAVAMTVMRLVGNTLVTRTGRRNTVTLGAILVSLGFAMVVLIPHVLGSIAGFLVVGIGAANIVPQLVSFAGTVKGLPVQSTISIINALGYSGVLAGPVIIGFVSDLYSLSVTFMGIAAVMLLVGMVGFMILGRKSAPDIKTGQSVNEE
ncbi:MAG: MFS transporter [Succinivibrio sp.]|nr:MFS transporter [Succinivibrio sp.]